MMKRKLITQMCNEWRSNVWMMIELFVVGLVLWYVFTNIFGLSMLHKEPTQADYTGVYSANLASIPESSSKYRPYDEEHTAEAECQMILAQLRSNPYVEIVGTGSNALPYNFSYQGNTLDAEIDGKKESYYGNKRTMSPETIKAIRLRGINGETPEQLAEIIKRGDMIIGTTEVSWSDTDPLRWRGKQVTAFGDSSKLYNIAAIVDGIRRSDYEMASGTIIVNGQYNQVIIRVKEGKEREFKESIGETEFASGNTYLTNFESVESFKDDVHGEVMVVYRNMTVCAIFVLVSIFLGFLGSFWYRTQQRVPELALRKVNGATDSDLLRRFLSEGLLLLVIPSILMVPTGIFLLKWINSEEGGGSALMLNMNGMPMGQWVMWGGLATAIAAMAIMIVAGIWMPARKAMKVQPAYALKDQ